MNELIKEILMLFGIGSIALICVFIVMVLYDFISTTIRDLRWTYKRKRRFDKPPTAKCYCKDCIYYRVDNGYGRCTGGHIDRYWNIADSWFCWKAEPMKHDPERGNNE